MAGGLEATGKQWPDEQQNVGGKWTNIIGMERRSILSEIAGFFPGLCCSSFFCLDRC